MRNNNNNSNTGVSFFGLLAILFIAFKLTGVIDWSWWHVLAPLWLPTLVVIVFAVVIVVVESIKR